MTGRGLTDKDDLPLGFVESQGWLLHTPWRGSPAHRPNQHPGAIMKARNTCRELCSCFTLLGSGVQHEGRSL